MIEHGWFSYCLKILRSISIEEAFYFIAPLTIFFVRKEHRLIAICFALIAVGPLYRFSARERVIEYYGFLSCFDSIAYG
jgi:peptidoglycan/LPS O-acetylase OafA/YrhL